MAGEHESVSIFLPSGAFILNERSRHHHWTGEGLLSLKTFPCGQALYAVDDARYLLDAGTYLVLNEGHHYTITVEARNPVESFCVFFAPGAADEARRSMIASNAALLDDPTGYSVASTLLFERLYPHDTLVSPALAQLRRALTVSRTNNALEPGWVDDFLHALLVRLLRAQGQVWNEVHALPAVRAATREEIYRRLYHARDYAHASLHEPLTLNDLAHVAAMSPTHFLRVFRQVFHQTPHQYLTALRITRSQTLLRETDCSVTEICRLVGFESLGSFSWLFRKRMGISPAGYRFALRHGAHHSGDHADRSHADNFDDFEEAAASSLSDTVQYEGGLTTERHHVPTRIRARGVHSDASRGCG